MPPKPPQKQITSFSQIDISKLDVKDLQNIDYQKLLKDVRQRPDTAISFAAPVLAIFICFHLFTRFQAEQKKLTSQITEMKEKVALVDEYTKTQADYDHFIKSLPEKITESEFINKITDLAVKNHVQIESYTPGQNKNDPLFELVNISLDANTDNFNNMGNFISDIENTGLAIRINTWTATMGKRSQSAQRRTSAEDSQDESVINFRMEISSVTFKI